MKTYICILRYSSYKFGIGPTPAEAHRDYLSKVENHYTFEECLIFEVVGIST